ncbi:MAG: PA14 domain-containing protein, partial [Planctomycetota bacterium]
MYRKMVLAFVVVCVLGFSVCSVVPAAAAEDMSAEEQIKAGHGLIGTYYNDDDFDEREVGMIDLLPKIDYEWADSRGNDWSARWFGFVKGPITGEVTFITEAQDGIRLTMGNTVVIDSLKEAGIHAGKVNMTRGQKTPIKLEFVCSDGKALLRLYWQWAGREKEIIPASALSHSTEGLPQDFMVFDFDKRPSEQDSGDDDDSEVLDFLPRFTGGAPPYADTDYLDGRFRPVVGVHNFEVIRCNRTYPELVTDDIPSYPDAGINNVGFTYNHA